MFTNSKGTPSIFDDPDYGKPWLPEDEETTLEVDEMPEETELTLEDGTPYTPDYRAMAQNRKRRDLPNHERPQRPQRP